MEVKDLTIRQVVAANRAIARVRDQKQPGGMAAAGVTFPTMIMFRNAWTQNEIQSCIKGYDEAVSSLREKYNKTKMVKGKEVPTPWTAENMKDFNKEVEKLLDSPATSVELKTFPLSELNEIDDDEYLKEVNKEHPVPQEYFSLLMEAGLLEDDVTKSNGKKKGK